MLDNPLSAYLAVTGAALLVGGLALMVSRVRLRLLGRRTLGEVVSYTRRMQQRPGEAPAWMPVVRFTSADGVERQFQSRTGARPDRWPPGTQVPVYFAPMKPDQAEIAAAGRLWIAPASLLAFGLVLLLAASKAAHWRF